MKKVPLPLQVFGGVAVLALLLSGAWGLLRGEDLSLVLEPADREDAVRLGIADELR